MDKIQRPFSEDLIWDIMHEIPDADLSLYKNQFVLKTIAYFF